MDVEVILDKDEGQSRTDGISSATLTRGLTLISTLWVIDIDSRSR
jgi:hypothetical protein